MKYCTHKVINKENRQFVEKYMLPDFNLNF
jgi:hypothetical protein